MRYTKLLLFIAIVAILLNSCVEEPPRAPAKGDTTRTILVYMIATNSLGSYEFDLKDIDEMSRAVATQDLNNCRLLVYYVSYGALPTLFEIKKSDGKAIKNMLKEYTEVIPSTTKERMSEVINDVVKFAPAKDYGLVLWSHASGWARTLSARNRLMSIHGDNPFYLTRDFGEDRGNQMPLDELATALPNNMFSFIYADVCYMGGVEVAYQLRNKTKFFVASPTLLPADGMPYDKNIPAFCENEPNLEKACRNTYEYYNALPGYSRTVTISLTDCSKLTDLAKTCREIYTVIDPIIDISSIQKYAILNDGKCIFFDFGQYTTMIAPTEKATEFKSKLESAVIYKAATPSIFGEFIIDPNKFSGLSTYILGTSNATNEAYYKTLDWYLAVYK